MNKNVAKAMIVLSVCTLLCMYVAKIFFPKEFVFCVQNERVLAVGAFIQNNDIAFYIVGSLASFMTYWLYLCAVCKKKSLSIREIGMVIETVLISVAISMSIPDFSMHFSIASMLILPAMMGARLKEVAVVYSVHGLAQVLSLKIRDLPLYVQSTDMFSSMLLTAEMYFWLVLFYAYYNYERK